MEENNNQPPNEENIDGEIIPKKIKKINPNSFVPVMDKMAELFGEEFLDCKNEKVDAKDTVFDCTLLGVLFSCGWGSPCRIFKQDLINIYEAMNEGKKRIEIIQVSFDHNEDEFKKSIVGLPWKFLPLNSPKIEALKKKFNVLTVPKFFPIDKNGNILSNTGREDLLEYGVDICDKWNEDARVADDIDSEEEEVKIEDGEEGENGED